MRYKTRVEAIAKKIRPKAAPMIVATHFGDLYHFWDLDGTERQMNGAEWEALETPAHVVNVRTATRLTERWRAVGEGSGRLIVPVSLTEAEFTARLPEYRAEMDAMRREAEEKYGLMA